MTTSISVTITDDVADTLFIPLYMRSLETRRKNGIINDPLACQLVDKIDYDFTKYGNANKSQVGTSIRIRSFDQAVIEFVRKHKDPVVVSIGAGLDTRFHRVYDGKGTFYEVDLPEVIKVRRQLLPESEKNPYIAQSMFETDWMETIVSSHPDASFILVAEGVFMYFKEKEIYSLLMDLVRRFPRGELHFDVVSPWGVRSQKKHDTVKKAKANFQWGFKDNRLLERWSPRLRCLGTSHYMSQELRRWGLFGVAARMFPPLNNAYRMVHYAIDPVK